MHSPHGYSKLPQFWLSSLSVPPPPPPTASPSFNDIKVNTPPCSECGRCRSLNGGGVWKRERALCFATRNTTPACREALGSPRAPLMNTRRLHTLGPWRLFIRYLWWRAPPLSISIRVLREIKSFKVLRLKALLPLKVCAAFFFFSNEGNPLLQIEVEPTSEVSHLSSVLSL